MCDLIDKEKAKACRCHNISHGTKLQTLLYFILHKTILIKDTDGSREHLERERENSNMNSKTLFYKDCSLSSFKNLSNN